MSSWAHGKEYSSTVVFDVYIMYWYIRERFIPSCYDGSSIILNLIICNDILLWMFYAAHVRFNVIL